MPLHDWTDRPGWEGVHHLWITELLRWIKPRLPAGYRAYIGTAPTVAIGASQEDPDIGDTAESPISRTTQEMLKDKIEEVLETLTYREREIIKLRYGGVGPWLETTGELAPANAQPAGASADMEPDEEFAVTTLDPGKALLVELRGRLVAAVELVSPRNKDRQVARATYSARYCGYLLQGVHLLLADVHPRPRDFSFADRIAQELQIRQEPLPSPAAVSYRSVGRLQPAVASWAFGVDR